MTMCAHRYVCVCVYTYACGVLCGHVCFRNISIYCNNCHIILVYVSVWACVHVCFKNIGTAIIVTT